MAGTGSAKRAAVVLAGGRSVRMGTSKAALEWHGSTLLRRTVGVVARGCGGPVVVVRAPGQQLPALPTDVLVSDDPVEGLGPLQGLAVGLGAAAELGAQVAFACSTDLPFLHVAYVHRVLAFLDDELDVVLPVARGFRQPLAAGYRTALAPRCARLVAAGRRKPAFLFDEVRTAVLDEAALLADPWLAAVDPLLESVVNVNTAGDYAAARARPAPLVTLQPSGRQLRAATVAGLGPFPDVRAIVDGRDVDGQTPLVEGDVVTIKPA